MTSLMQDQTWTTQDGETLKLEDMTPSHRRNLLAFLERRARRLLDRYIWNLCSGPEPIGDAAVALFESMLEAIEVRDPIEWLNETVFVKRLRQLIAEDEENERGE
jgi:hypothetical protein